MGTIIAWPLATNPPDAANWLECNGQSTSGYPALAAVIGATVPDLRGKFLRGLGGNSAGLGVTQGDAIRNITGHAPSDLVWPENISIFKGAMFYKQSLNSGDGGPGPSGESYSMGFDASRVVPTANENRPVNMAVRYLIRARP